MNAVLARSLADLDDRLKCKSYANLARSTRVRDKSPYTESSCGVAFSTGAIPLKVIRGDIIFYILKVATDYRSAIKREVMME